MQILAGLAFTLGECQASMADAQIFSCLIYTMDWTCSIHERTVPSTSRTHTHPRFNTMSIEPSIHRLLYHLCFDHISRYLVPSERIFARLSEMGAQKVAASVPEEVKTSILSTLVFAASVLHSGVSVRELCKTVFGEEETEAAVGKQKQKDRPERKSYNCLSESCRRS